MDERLIDPREAIRYAREALRRGDATHARQWAEFAAKLAPQREEPWLLLAAVSGPHASMEYVRKALQINPDSARALKAMAWAVQRLDSPAAKGNTAEGVSLPRRVPRPGDLIGTLRANPVPTSNSAGVAQTGALETPGVISGEAGAARTIRRRRARRSALLPVMLLAMGCAALGFAAWSAVTSPVLASILSVSSFGTPAPTHAPWYARVDIAKPTPTATSVPPFVAAESATDLASLPQAVDETMSATADLPSLPNPEPTEPPAATAEPISSPALTETPGTLYAEIVPDTPTPEYVPPTAGPVLPDQPLPRASGGGGHWIDVDLSQQRVYAYEGDTVVNSFLASTGTWQTPTVTGKYQIWIKLRSTTMTGPGYYLTDVPYTMYFYKGYGLHGTYWHNNFGTPMSHGCVNLSIPDAAWLYDFAAVGTTVNVHY